MIEKELKNYIDSLIDQCIPVGSILCYSSSTAPDGYLPCDGRELLQSQYPSLFKVIGLTFGGTPRTFNLPDLQGRFVRGWDKEGDTDPERIFGTPQEDAFQGHGHVSSCTANGEHHHSIEYSGEALNQAKPKYCEWQNWIVRCLKHPIWHYAENRFSETEKQGAHTHSITIASPNDSSYGKIRVSTETRPQNIALLYCIKVK